MSNQNEQYSPGYRPKLINDYKQRHISKEASFFIPYLHSGMMLLDCGCGPGSITEGFAGIVQPGLVYGIDIEHEQIAASKKLAQHKQLKNMKFKVANVYNLPFGNDLFDAVFAHTLLQHLKDPNQALKEMYRVLKPGGIIGVRDDDQGSLILSPSNTQLEKLIHLFAQFLQYKGGNPYIGRQHRQLLRQAGFFDIEASASCHYHGNSKAVCIYAEVIDDLLQSVIAETAIQQGWATTKEIKTLVDACQSWGNNPDAFDAITFCEAVAWKLKVTD